jgi:Questin oxidase-like
MSLTLSPTLKALLDDGAAFDAEFGRRMSSHRSMALLALARLNAPASRLVQFEAVYARRLRPAPPRAAWPAGAAWASRLGDPSSWPAYRDLFWHWLASEDAAEVLRQALPRLMRGCGGVAYHGLIRTAYAVQAQHHQELADALAHWACGWLDLGSAPPGTEPDPEVVLRGLPVVDSSATMIAERMAVAAADPRFQAQAARTQAHAGTLQRLAVLAAEAYAASGNFVALHLVTSAHALRVLQPYLDEPLAACADYARAFNAGVCVARLAVAAPVPLLPWPRIVERAIASDDDHVIKLVDSAREQQAAYGGSVWQRAASRAVV